MLGKWKCLSEGSGGEHNLVGARDRTQFTRPGYGSFGPKMYVRWCTRCSLWIPTDCPGARNGKHKWSTKISTEKTGPNAERRYRNCENRHCDAERNVPVRPKRPGR